MNTTDIALAAYLKTKGFSYTIIKGSKNIFEFEDSNEVSIKVENFFNNDGCFLEFFNNVRILKSHAINKKG